MSEILVGIDSSAGAQDAVAFAKQLALVTGARLRLANAYPYDDTPSRAANEAFREALRADSTDMLAEVDAGDAPRHAVADVSPARALHRLADEHGASLIVVGSTHRGPVGRVLPGSTGERLLHGSPCPVAMVPKGYGADDHAIRVIGVGYDGSDESESALASAIEVARLVNATVRVIRVFDATEIGTPALMTGPAWVAVPGDIEDRQRRHFEHRMAALPKDVDVTPVFCAGSPHRELADQSQGVDLMITGSRGYGPLHAVLLGGVTHTIVRRAACPVMVLPRGAKRGLGEMLVPAAEATA